MSCLGLCGASAEQCAQALADCDAVFDAGCLAEAVLLARLPAFFAAPLARLPFCWLPMVPLAPRVPAFLAPAFLAPAFLAPAFLAPAF